MSYCLRVSTQGRRWGTVSATDMYREFKSRLLSEQMGPRRYSRTCHICGRLPSLVSSGIKDGKAGLGLGLAGEAAYSNSPTGRLWPRAGRNLVDLHDEMRQDMFRVLRIQKTVRTKAEIAVKKEETNENLNSLKPAGTLLDATESSLRGPL